MCLIVQWSPIIWAPGTNFMGDNFFHGPGVVGGDVWGCFKIITGFPSGSAVKNPATQKTQEMQVRSLGQKDPLEKSMAAHSSILAWRIPWTEEPGGLEFSGKVAKRYD